MDFNKIFDTYLYQILIVLTGIGASFVRVSMQKKQNFKDFFIGFLSGIASSIFFCWIAYEICFYFTQSQQFSLAIGAFCAWQGGEWIKSIVDDFIKHRIIQKDKKDNDGEF